MTDRIPVDPPPSPLDDEVVSVARTLGEWKTDVRNRWQWWLDSQPRGAWIAGLRVNGTESAYWMKTGDGNALWQSGANIVSSITL